MEGYEEGGIWLPVAGFHEMKTSLMQTHLSPTALPLPLLPRYLDPVPRKFPKGCLSPQVPSEPIPNVRPGPLCCVRSLQMHRVALPSISSLSHRAGRLLLCSRDGWSLRVQHTAGAMC